MKAVRVQTGESVEFLTKGVIARTGRVSDVAQPTTCVQTAKSCLDSLPEDILVPCRKQPCQYVMEMHENAYHRLETNLKSAKLSEPKKRGCSLCKGRKQIGLGRKRHYSEKYCPVAANRQNYFELTALEMLNLNN